MRNDEFEWDDGKASANLRKHRVSFEDACSVFDDPMALVEADDDPDESRDITIGLSAKGILYVVSTERGTRTRIISARKATRHEQDRYQGTAPARR
jgi:hypothetical protein